MASSFPGAIDSFTDPLSGSPLNSPSHSAQHADLNDAAEKIETYALNLPKGVVGKAQKTTATSVTTGETDISGMSVTWTAAATRLYRISVACIARTTAAGNLYITISITDSANNTKQLIRNGATTTDMRFGLTGFVYESGLSGSVTRKLRVAIVGGTGEIEANSTFPFQMIVEDIGVA
jgi:hypothetical protein